MVEEKAKAIPDDKFIEMTLFLAKETILMLQDQVKMLEAENEKLKTMLKSTYLSGPN